jgi:hypothetical protein
MLRVLVRLGHFIVKYRLYLGCLQNLGQRYGQSIPRGQNLSDFNEHPVLL